MAIDRSTIWPYEAGEPGRFYYSRYDHPIGVEAEEALGDLDGGQALLFSSGAAASTAALFGLLEPGQTVALAEGCYYGTALLLRELGRWGIRLVEFDQTSAPPAGADLVWLEAPSNPFLSFPDLEAATAHGGTMLVDATASTAVLLRALVVRNQEHFERIKKVRGLTGPIAAPDSAWLLLRGLKTLRVRVERQSASALELAGRLDAHPAVERVRYPGLGDERAARYMQ